MLPQKLTKLLPGMKIRVAVPISKENCYIIAKFNRLRGRTRMLSYTTAPPLFISSVESNQTNMIVFTLFGGIIKRLLRWFCKVHQVPAAIKEASPRGGDKTLREPQRIRMKPWIIYLFCHDSVIIKCINKNTCLELFSSCVHGGTSSSLINTKVACITEQQLFRNWNTVVYSNSLGECCIMCDILDPRWWLLHCFLNVWPMYG